MFTLKELIHVLLVILLFAFIIGFLQDTDALLIALALAAIILFVNVIAKKITAAAVDAKIEHKIWQWQRWGWYERSHFKRPIPAGLIFPFVLIWLSYPFGFLKILTFLQFDAKPSITRVAKRRGAYRYSELTEWHIALIAGGGIIATLVLALIAYLLNYPELARFAIFYSSWNTLLPISQLDGCKILFGSKIFWFILSAICLIGLVFAFFII